MILSGILFMATDENKKAVKLAEYASSLPGFRITEAGSDACDHMGAVITEAILQAGLNYRTVVLPRIKRLRELHPEAGTTSRFIGLAEKEGLNSLILWKDAEKPSRIMNAARFLESNHVETVEDLGQWLADPDNVRRLKELRGIGDKTIDYFRILTGVDTGAVDRHVLRFLGESGIKVSGYGEARDILNGAADLLGAKRRDFDRSILRYMAARKKKDGPG
jgi:hypothetical protein